MRSWIRIAVGIGAAACVGTALLVATHPRHGSTGATGAPGGELVCPYGVGDAGTTTGGTEVRYDKRCDTVSDCVTGVHLLDCCGTAIVLGARSSEASRFAQADGICGVHAACRCAGRGVFAEDGNASLDPGNLSDVDLACHGGLCVTRIVAGAAKGLPSPIGTPIPSATGSPVPSSTAFDDWVQSVAGGCSLPSPADCRYPSACKSSLCVCRSGMWTCTPDCNGCGAASPPPVIPSASPPSSRGGPTMTRPECDPPYTWDDAGHKRYKVDCLAH